MSAPAPDDPSPKLGDDIGREDVLVTRQQCGLVALDRERNIVRHTRALSGDHALKRLVGKADRCCLTAIGQRRDTAALCHPLNKLSQIWISRKQIFKHRVSRLTRHVLPFGLDVYQQHHMQVRRET